MHWPALIGAVINYGQVYAIVWSTTVKAVTCVLNSKLFGAHPHPLRPERQQAAKNKATDVT